jgi:hypothetical protein
MVDLRFRRASVRGFSWTGARRRDVVWGGGGGAAEARRMLESRFRHARAMLLSHVLAPHPPIYVRGR